MHDLAVHRDGFHRAVRMVENRSPGGLIDAAGLHADVSVFHDVDLADAMFAAEDV